MEVRIKAPLDEAVSKKLRAGDRVLIDGVLYTARDAAHSRFAEIIKSGGRLPVDLTGQIIYYVGPTPAKGGMPTGSAGPTTSSRMNPYIPGLLKASGLKAIIGKGEISEAAIAALRECGAVYLAAVGGAGALLAEKIMSAEVVAWPELGTEAVHRFLVRDFPAVVVIDLKGGNLYTSGRKHFRRLSPKK